VLKGLFRLVSRLYGIRITRSDAPTWDAEVRRYVVTEEPGGETLAAFYVDLYPRENKRGGAWMNTLRTGVQGDADPRHVGLLCANVQPPVEGRPTLLSHREAETLSHELGHLMHLVLSRVPVRSLAGTNVAWDFVELPSQIMENFCWEKTSLELIARHHETREPMPDALFEKMRRARTYRAATAMMRQLGFGTVDLGLHTTYDPAADGPAVAYSRRVFQEHTPAPLPEEYAMLASFSHLFGSPVGYAAAYYSYKWAEVLEADAFSRFREEGILSPAVGAAFRREILEKGDSDEPMALYTAFRGRPPKLEPLLLRAGLLQERTQAGAP
jgi:oligopeptidase A